LFVIRRHWAGDSPNAYSIHAGPCADFSFSETCPRKDQPKKKKAEQPPPPKDGPMEKNGFVYGLLAMGIVCLVGGAVCLVIARRSNPGFEWQRRAVGLLVAAIFAVGAAVVIFAESPP
jgi:hypothetical protein